MLPSETPLNPVRVADPTIAASEVQADGIGRTGSDDSPDRGAAHLAKEQEHSDAL
jgi:hypothetical protein